LKIKKSEEDPDKNKLCMQIELLNSQLTKEQNKTEEEIRIKKEMFVRLYS